VTELSALRAQSLLASIRQALPDPAGIWLVGGAVRDALLGRDTHDMDFAVAQDARQAARAVANALGADYYALDADRDVGRVLVSRPDGPFLLDFARLRGPDLSADLAARDFTINAMAVPLAGPEKLVDPLGGETDLRSRVIRACSAGSIANDPVRGLRAVRLATQLRCRIEPETRRAVRAQAGALAAASPERLRDELIQCVGGDRASTALRALDRLGLLASLLPELLPLKSLRQSPPHEMDAWEHTLAVVSRLEAVLEVLGPVHSVDAASDMALGQVSLKLGRYRSRLDERLGIRMGGGFHPTRWLLKLAAVLHDIGKPQTASADEDGGVHFYQHPRVGSSMAAERMALFHFSGEETRFVQTVVENHMRPAQLSRADGATRRAIYHYYRDTGPAGVEAVLLSLADRLGKFRGHAPPQDKWERHVAVCAELLGAGLERLEECVSPVPVITGDDLKSELGLREGPQIGRLLEAVREAQAVGEVTDRAAALALARQRQESKAP
jgi:tRNA nucleotidyltransferase/poly(A) polymerase